MMSDAQAAAMASALATSITPSIASARASAASKASAWRIVAASSNSASISGVVCGRVAQQIAHRCRLTDRKKTVSSLPPRAMSSHQQPSSRFRAINVWRRASGTADRTWIGVIAFAIGKIEPRREALEHAAPEYRHCEMGGLQRVAGAGHATRPDRAETVDAA